MSRLAGRTCVVTGGAAGIGAATVLRLARDGGSVIALDIAEDKGAQLEAQARTAGLPVRFIRCDVARDEDWADVVDTLSDGLDLLVSNAVTVEFGSVEELSLASWDRQLQVGLSATFLGVRHCAALLRRSRGSVVVTSSVHAHFGFPRRPAYAAVKGGLLALTRQLAVDFGPDIRVNAVVPGPIDTDAWRLLTDDQREAAAYESVLQRLGSADEVASVVAFLASDDASYVTGAAVTVDGGWSIMKHSG